MACLGARPELDRRASTEARSRTNGANLGSGRASGILPGEPATPNGILSVHQSIRRRSHFFSDQQAVDLTTFKWGGKTPAGRDVGARGEPDFLLTGKL